MRGWRLTLANCSLNQIKQCEIKIQKTGGIFIVTSPKKVKIKIENRFFEDQSGILKSGTLISNLIPKTYKVTVSKDGYHKWEKNIKVLPSLVSNAQTIILIPSRISSKHIPLKIIRGNSLIDFFINNNFITEDTNRKIFYFYSPNNQNVLINLNASLHNLKHNENLKNVRFHPFDGNKFIIETKNNLYLFDIEKTEITNLPIKKPLIWNIVDPNIYYITTEQTTSTLQYKLASFNLILKLDNYIMDLTTATTTKITTFVISPDQKKIAYSDEANNFYLANLKEKLIQKISSQSQFFAFSPDSQKLVFSEFNCRNNQTNTCSEQKLNIYFLEDYLDTISPKRKGDIMTLPIQNIKNIEKIAWYRTSNHLIIQQNNLEQKIHTLSFIEVDDKTPINEQLLIKDINDFFYHPKQNTIFYLQNQNLYSFSIEK